jgi:hypothetical protein
MGICIVLQRMNCHLYNVLSHCVNIISLLFSYRYLNTQLMSTGIYTFLACNNAGSLGLPS